MGRFNRSAGGQVVDEEEEALLSGESGRAVKQIDGEKRRRRKVRSLRGARLVPRRRETPSSL